MRTRRSCAIFRWPPFGLWIVWRPTAPLCFYLAPAPCPFRLWIRLRTPMEVWKTLSGRSDLKSIWTVSKCPALGHLRATVTRRSRLFLRQCFSRPAVYLLDFEFLHKGCKKRIMILGIPVPANGIASESYQCSSLGIAGYCWWRMITKTKRPTTGPLTRSSRSLQFRTLS